MNAMMMNDARMRILTKDISSNLIRAQQEENKGKDFSIRNSLFDQAGYDSVLLAKLLIKADDPTEGSRYFLSAAYSYEKSGAINQAISCFRKIIDIGEGEFLDRAREGLSRVGSNDAFDINTKEGKIFALDFLIWKHYGLTTTDAKGLFLREFNQDLSNDSIRSYANVLKERNRVIIWGGPQGREYHIYPNIADLATREEHYGHESLFAGSIERRITEKFNINFRNLDYNKEFFILNGTIIPQMLLAVDMNAFVQNLKSFSKPSYSVKALGILKKSTDLEDSGYEATLNEEFDLIDANVLYDGETEETIYERKDIGGT